MFSDIQQIHLEEDNYVAGLEWIERMGADLASSSLGYDIFDDTTRPNILFPQKDGKTGTTTKAARVAARGAGIQQWICHDKHVIRTAQPARHLERRAAADDRLRR